MTGKTTVTLEDKRKWCVEAYERGYSSYDFYNPSDFNLKQNFDALNETFLILIDENSDKKHLIWEVEEYYNFERGKHDWENFGIYGLIEDIHHCFSAGAEDGLKSKVCNPDRISHFWDW